MGGGDLLLSANETTRLDEIKVSANKMEENIQDVPQSIFVITKEDIEQKGIKNASDIIKELSNVDNETGVYGNISIRGLNTSIFTTNNPIVFYIDGVPL